MSFADAVAGAIRASVRPLVVDEAAARALEEACAAARAEWPEAIVPDAVFARWLVDRLPAAVPIAVAPQIGRMADLYVACACAAGSARAVAAFERRFFGEVVRAAGRSAHPALSRDDLRQAVRERLFVGVPPRIADYAGQGSLRSWLRVVTARVVLNVVAKPERDIPVEAEFLAEIATGGGEVEFEHLKRLYRADFEAAVADAIPSLAPKDKNVLFYVFVQGLSIDELGAVYRVHRATAARWIAGAREALADATRRALSARLGASDSEIDSIVRLIESRFDLTLDELCVPPSG